jgi:hypothetical protein
MEEKQLLAFDFRVYGEYTSEVYVIFAHTNKEAKDFLKQLLYNEQIGESGQEEYWVKEKGQEWFDDEYDGELVPYPEAGDPDTEYHMRVRVTNNNWSGTDIEKYSYTHTICD